MAKLTRSGIPRKKPGPKPKTIASIQAGTHDALGICLQAYDAHADDPKQAAEAYRRAMPPMHAVSVQDWASIVAQGMARRALTGQEASTMLYAAQVAHK
jgi:hypothetical protein